MKKQQLIDTLELVSRTGAVRPPFADQLSAWESHVDRMTQAFHANAERPTELALKWDGREWVIEARHRVWVDDNNDNDNGPEHHSIESMRMATMPHGTPISDMIRTGNRMWNDCRNQARSIVRAIRNSVEGNNDTP